MRVTFTHAFEQTTFEWGEFMNGNNVCLEISRFYTRIECSGSDLFI